MHRPAVLGGMVIVVLLVALRPTSGAAQDQTPTPTAGGSAIAAPGASDALKEVRSLAGKVLGAGTYPGYAVEVPEGWSNEDGAFIIRQGPVVMGISVWSPKRSAMPRNLPTSCSPVIRAATSNGRCPPTLS